jgi:hypothetical protein
VKYSDQELLAAIDREESQSYQTTSGLLKTERDNALDYYLGEPFGNEIADRSQVVTRDVLDTIEWVLPSLLKTFLAGDEIVKFNPTTEEDIEAAEQETAVVNFIIQQKNPGFQIFHTWFKDALLEKTGYAKVYWEETKDYQDERFEGLTEDELAYILADKTLEILSQQQYQDAFGMPLYTVKLRQVVPCKQVKIINVPPEEMYVSTRTRSVSLKDAPFVEHRYYKTVSDLRDAGYKLDMTKMSGFADIEDQERNIYDEAAAWQQDETEEAMRTVLMRDCYMRVDDDDDGIAELKRVLVAGTQVIEREEAEFIPFAAICPIPMSHRHVGLSYADLVMDLQLIKSTITRQILDNMYLSNNVRNAIDPSRVNLDDMLVSRPGGVVRTKGDPSGAIMPLVNPPIYQQSFGMLEYIDSMRENRTGVTKYNQGMDANSLNKTATGISAIMGASQQRLELVARLFAEGVKEMFMMVHALQAKYADAEETIQLRGKYIAVDPRGWKKRTDMTISVGLGTGNKDQMAQQFMLILQAQKEALMSGTGLATPKNVYHALIKMTENAGFKDADQFWTNPEGEGQQQPAGPSPEQIQQVQQHIQQLTEENQKLQQELAKRDTDSSVEVYKIDKQSETEIQKVQMQNDNKELLASMKAVTDAIMQSQTQMDDRMAGMENSMPDMSPMMETIKALQEQITGMQPVGIKQVRDESGKLIGGVRVLADGTEQKISIQ